MCGNFVAGPDIDDMTPIRLILETVPVDYVFYAIRQKADRRSYPGNPPLKSWRDPAFLRTVAENFCASMIIPSLVDGWSKATAKPTGNPADASNTSTPAQVPPERKDAPVAPPGNRNGFA